MRSQFIVLFCLFYIFNSLPVLANSIDADKIFSDGYELLQNQKYDQAMLQFSKVLALDSNHKEALLNIGYIYLIKGQQIRAKEIFSQLVKVYPSFSQAWLNLGVIAAQEKKWKESKRYYKTALSFSPGHPTAIRALKEIDIILKSFKQDAVSVNQDIFTLNIKPLLMPIAESPFTPITLSAVFPGSGQIFNGVKSNGKMFDIIRGAIYASIAGLSMIQINNSVNSGEDISSRWYWMATLGLVTIAAPIDALITTKTFQNEPNAMQGDN